MVREVAQAGSAPGLGPGGRRFESCLPDEVKINRKIGLFLFKPYQIRIFGGCKASQQLFYRILIVSFDTIMKSSYDISSKLLELPSSSPEKLVAITAIHLETPKAELRKQNRIKAIQASLEIEGNTLTIDQGRLLGIDEALSELVLTQRQSLSSAERVELFIKKHSDVTFTRKEYLQMYKDVSAPTVSRDLKGAVAKRFLEKKGDKNLTKYRVKTKR